MKNHSYSLIGDYDSLLLVLSKGFSEKYFGEESNNILNYNNCYFDDINMGNDFSHFIYERYTENDDGILYTITTEYSEEKRYLFFDGLNRIIDVRLLKNEAFNIYLSKRHEKIRFFYGKYRKRNGRKRHSRNSFKHFLGHKKQVLTLDDMFDTEYKEYHFKHLEDSVNRYPDWWDDTSRRVEGNWKSQYKTNRQYNIHNNGKNNKSIRKYFEEEISNDKIDEMLLEDFLKNNTD